MSYTKNWTNYVWIIPLIALIIGVIGLLTPTGSASAMYMGLELELWMWGLLRTNLFVGPGVDPEILFIPELIIPSLICTGIIVAFLIVILVFIIREKVGNPSGVILIVSGAIIIATTIAYTVMSEAGFELYLEREYGVPPGSLGLWDYAKESFGISGPIICGIIAIVGGAISKYAERVGGSSPAPSKSTMTAQPVNPQYNPANYSNTTPGGSVGQKAAPLFCGQCGAEQKGEGLFCGKCGARF